MQLRVGIVGAGGRMGRMVAEQARAAGLIIAGGIDRPGAPVGDVPLVASISVLSASCDVLIDFTHASTVAEHAEAVGASGVGWVLGTTGLSASDDDAVARAAVRAPVVQAANFSPGVNLMLVLAQQMGAALPADEYDAEILEMHHRQKVDAPSGTALALGRAVARGRGVAFEAARDPPRDGETGTRRTGAIGFAALRGGQIVGEHTVLFAAAGEQMALTHRAFDRRSFAAGAVRAAAWVAGRRAGLYGMPDVLGLQ